MLRGSSQVWGALGGAADAMMWLCEGEEKILPGGSILQGGAASLAEPCLRRNSLDFQDLT